MSKKYLMILYLIHLLKTAKNNNAINSLKKSRLFNATIAQRILDTNQHYQQIQIVFWKLCFQIVQRKLT